MKEISDKETQQNIRLYITPDKQKICITAKANVGYTESSIWLSREAVKQIAKVVKNEKE